MFAPALAAVAVFTPLAILAFGKLARVSGPLRTPVEAAPARALGALPITA
jgi:hypothetical protein